MLTTRSKRTMSDRRCQRTRGKKRRSAWRRPTFEPLEDRQLLAAAFGYDPTGGGGSGDDYIRNVQTFDWKPDNALAVGGSTALQNWLLYGPNDPLHPVTFITFAQSDLGTLIDQDSHAIAIPGGRQITSVARLPQKVTSVNIGADAINSQFSGAPGDSYIEIFTNPVHVANPLAGTGYNVGTRILAASIDTLFSTFSQAINASVGILDNHGVNDYDGVLNAPNPALFSLTGTGAVVFSGVVNFVDNDYFPTIHPGAGVKWTMNNPANLVVPFNQVDPAARFLTDTTTTAVGAVAIPAGAGNPFDPVLGIGVLNTGPQEFGGGTCVQEQQDASTSFDRTVNIGNYVWTDTNGNGVQDTTETGLNGVTVNLVNLIGQPVLVNGQPVTTVTAHDPATNTDGYYEFRLLPPGTYRVQFVLPSGYAFTKRFQGGDPTTDSNPDPSTGLSGSVSLPLTMLSGLQDFADQTIDAGLYIPVRIGDFVWNDSNGNGIQDSDEPGIAEVTLTLTGTNGSGDMVTDHATTDPTGHYGFAEAPGAYTVTLAPDNYLPGGALAGFIPTPTLQGSDRNVDSNPNPSGTTPSTLLSDGDDTTIDFGERRAVDLAITKGDGSPTYTPGSLVRYTITVSNLGPSDAVGATVADLVPAILTGVSWTTSVLGGANVTSGGSGSGNNLAAMVNVPAGAGNGVVFTVSGTAAASATANLVNTATVSPPNNVTDTDLANNTATDTDTAALQADLRITKDDGSLTYTPGNLVRYTITVSNNGPSDAVGATVADLVPAILTSVSWTTSVLGGANVISGASGSGNNLAAMVNVPAGAGNGVVFTVSGTALASATANLVNTATVSPPANVTDADLANNTATDVDTAALQADLRITKDDGSLTYTPGNLVRYTITVSNNGPSDAVGATVADLVPAILTSVSWTTSVLGGANVTSGASGSGNNLAAMVNVPAGAGNGVVFTVSGTAVASATANLVNTATVSPPNNFTDTDLANNTATDVDTAALQADLRITKDDGSLTYTPGNLVRYTITVSNNGPSDAVGATVADLVPAILAGVSWTSSALGGANVTSGASGTGNNLAAMVNVPAGVSNGVVFTVSGTAVASATTNLVNTATVSPPNNVTDTDLANNTATDTDTAALRADLRITKDDDSLTYTPGNLVRYTITVSNSGPSDAVGATVADLVPAILTGVSWTTSVLGGANVTSGGSGSGNNLAAMVNVPAGAGNGQRGGVHGQRDGRGFGHGQPGEHGHGQPAQQRHGHGPREQHGDGHGYRGSAGRSADHERRRLADVHAGKPGALHDHGQQPRPQRRPRGHGGRSGSGDSDERQLDHQRAGRRQCHQRGQRFR